jgi:hypothetical protein
MKQLTTKAAILALILCAQVTAQAPATAVVSGTVYKIYQGQQVPAANAVLWVEKIVKAGSLYSTQRSSVRADANGFVTLTLPRNSTVYLSGEVLGLDKTGGVGLAIPDSATATIESLVHITSVPTTGIVVKQAGSALPNKEGTINFTGATVTETTPGSVTVAISSGVTDHGLLTGLSDDDHPQYLTVPRANALYSLLTHVHSVDGVTGLQELLDAKASNAALTSEAATRAAADTTLQTNIDAEATARATAISSASTADRARANQTGTQPLSTISDAGTAASKDVPATGDASSVQVVLGSDSRLSDSRTPLSHTHTESSITTLVSDLAGKEPSIAAGTTAQFWRGDKAWATLDTSAVPENGNLYYTQGRFNTAFGAKTTDNLTEGTTNLFFTTSRASSAAPVQSVNSQTGTVVLTTTNVAEGTNLYHTSGRVTSLIAAAVGVSVQAYSAELAAIAGLSSLSNDDLIQRKAGAWTHRSPSQFKADLNIIAGDLSDFNASVDARGVSANTASRIVSRDASGNFSAGTITAALTGNASTATTLAANGSNCSAGNAAAGVDASGAAEGCAALPANTTATANQFFTAYNSTTGAFTKAQPAFSDLSGSITTSQQPSSTVNSVSNDTNLQGSISSQVLTFTWAGTLAKSRQNATTVYTDQANTFGAFLQKFQAGANFQLVDPTDTTKKAQFDVSNIATATTRTVNVPDANSTTAQSITCTNQFVSAMSAQGLFTCATVPNAALSNSSVTIGSTSVSLGGTATAIAGLTSVNKVAITAPATSATLTIADGKTATVSNSLTLAGTDSTTVTFQSISGSPSTVIHLFASGTGAGNTSTGETTLDTYTLPAAFLASGKGLRITAFGSYANNANNKTVKVYVGATVIAAPSTAASTGTWHAMGVVLYTGASAQVAWMRSAQTSGSNETSNTNTVTTPAEAVSGTIIIKVTGQSNTASSDVLLKGFIIEAIN